MAAPTIDTEPAPLPRRYNNPMKSTWQDDRSQWRWAHFAMAALAPSSSAKGTTPPVHTKLGRVPHLSEWSTNIWVLIHALWPIVIHQLYVVWKGHNPNVVLLFFFYAFALQVNSLKFMSILDRLGLQHGYLDGDKHKRDKVPDTSVSKVFVSLQLATTIRPLLAVFFAYRKDVLPSTSVSWTLPVQLALYAIILDFWFYVYHRACHEIDWLWKFHKTHHLTKHPNPLLTIFADAEQEFIEIFLIPLLTHAVLKQIGLPLSFYDWWICNAFIMFSEIFGHSGLRLHYVAAGTASPVLKLFDCELVLEDHDLHHRFGWKKTVSYGKQTRLWDKVFGTGVERIEMAKENIDYRQTVYFPLF